MNLELEESKKKREEMQTEHESVLRDTVKQKQEEMKTAVQKKTIEKQQVDIKLNMLQRERDELSKKIKLKENEILVLKGELEQSKDNAKSRLIDA